MMHRATHAKRYGPSARFNRVGLACQLEDDPPFCFSCEELFPDRMWLEEHLCPAMTYICSCGTEFSLYTDMMEHSSEHEPGHSVLHHPTIQRRRMETQRRAEEQLRSFRPMHGKQAPFPPASVPPWLSAPKPKVPTVDLWALYQPVVLIKTLRSFDKQNPFQCANCEQGFASKNELIRHHSAHIQNRVLGCLLCGMLLPTNESWSEPHVCHTSSTARMARITAAPKAVVITAPRATVTTAPAVFNNRNPVAFENKMALSKMAQAHALLKRQVRRHMADKASGGAFRCRMCLLPFQSANLLQRHKCVVASADYVKRQALMPNNYKRVKMLTTPHALPRNNVDRELKVNIQASRDVQVYHHHHKALEVPAVTVNTEVDSSDDDCIMIEPSSEPSQLFTKKNDLSPIPVIQL